MGVVRGGHSAWCWVRGRCDANVIPFLFLSSHFLLPACFLSSLSIVSAMAPSCLSSGADASETSGPHASPSSSRTSSQFLIH